MRIAALVSLFALTFQFNAVSQTKTNQTKASSEPAWVSTNNQPQGTTGQQSSPVAKWTAKPFDHKIFIENRGQFDDVIKNDENKKVLFQANLGDIKAYFTPNGIIYRYDKLVAKNNKEGEKEKDEIPVPVPKYLTAIWEGANPNATIDAGQEQTYYYTYPIGKNGTIKTNVFKKITYRNIYPGIDIEYIFPEDRNGIKYSVIVHPGADISLLKLKYQGTEDLHIDEKGNVIVHNSNMSDFTDHTPVSSYENGGIVNVKYSVKGREESFVVEGTYDKTKTVIIDPWSTSPGFTGGYNKAYDVDYDNKGNVYAYGGYNPFQLTKINAAGAVVWTFTTTLPDEVEYGDFAVDKITGTSYIGEGVNNGTGATAEKVNTNGILVATYPGNNSMREMWRLEYNACSNQIVIGGGGTNSPSGQVAMLDTNMITINPANPLGTAQCCHDVDRMTMDPVGGSVYFALLSPNNTSSSASSDNILMSVPVPALNPPSYNFVTGESFYEANSINYVGSGTYTYSTSSGTVSQTTAGAMNGMSASPNWLYYYDGYTLQKRNKATGGIVSSIGISAATTNVWGNNEIDIYWGGLASDGCDNVYVGSQSTIKVYNSSLSNISNIAMPSTIYDVVLGANDAVIYVAGNGYVQEVTNTVSTSVVATATTTNACTPCSGSATANLLLCGSTPAGITYSWSNGATTQTINGLCAGTYTVTMHVGCGEFFTSTATITTTAPPTVTVSPSTSICSGGPGASLTASGATTYTWAPATGLSATTGATVTANPASTTTYTVTGTTGGCTGTATVTVTVNALPTVSASAAPTTICAGGSATLTAGGAVSYTWSAGTVPATGSPVTANPAATTTYTVTGTDGNGCKNTQTVTVTVNPPPPVTASAAPTSICPGSSSTLTAGGAVSYTWSAGTVPATGSPVTATPGSTTTYTVTGTDAIGCTNTATVTVTVNPLPTITVAPPTPSICTGGNVSLTASGASTYTWNPSGSLSSSTGATVTSTPGGTTTYTVTGTDVNGCVNTQSVTVTVNPLPTITASAAPPTICPGASSTLTAGGASTYTWSAGTVPATGSPVTANPAVTTTYTVTGTDVNGCTNTQTVTVNVDPTPTVTVTPPSPGICPGGNVTLTAGGASTYTWSPSGSLSSSTGTTVTATPGSTQTYTIVGTDAAGCTAKDSVTITVGAIVVSASASSSTICNGSSTTITGSGAATYTWNPGALSGAVITVSPSVTTTYTLVGTAGSGCTDSTNITITVNPTPPVTVSTGTPNICPGDTAILTASGATTYAWSPPTGLNSTTSPTVDAGPGSSVTYTVTGTDGNGCTNTATVAINVSNIVVVPSAVNPSICNGSSTTLSATGATNYTWSPSTGLSATTGTPIIANPTSTTVYSVVGTTTGHCKDSVTITVTVNPKPTITVSASDTTPCMGVPTTLTAAGGSTYTWNPGTGLSATTGTTVTATPPAGPITYTVTGTDANGCDSTASITITVNPTPVVTIAPIAGGDTICPGQTASLSASGAVSYTWLPVTGLSCTNCPNPTATVSGAITYTVTGSNGVCTDSAKVSLFVTKPIVATITPNDSICAGKSVQIGISVTGGKPGYTYTWNNGLGTGTGPFNITPGSTGNYICTVKDACNDSIKDSVQVLVYPSPVAAFTATPDSILGGQFIAFNNTSTGANSWMWSMGDGTTSTDSFPYHQYFIPGDYIVQLNVSNSFGCKDSAVETVYVLEKIVVPNVFTPNGDGKNDVFHVTAGGMKVYSIEIFNRWGERVFIANSSDIDWTGRSTSGVEEADGVYYYEIKATDYDAKQYNLDGYLQLIRGGSH